MTTESLTFSLSLTSPATGITYTLRMPASADTVTIEWVDADGEAQTVESSVGSRGQLWACDVPDDDQAELSEAVRRLFDRASGPDASPVAPTVVDADGDIIELEVGDRVEGLAPDYDRGTIVAITSDAVTIAWEGGACLNDWTIVAGEVRFGGEVLVYAASSREPDWREPWEGVWCHREDRPADGCED